MATVCVLVAVVLGMVSLPGVAFLAGCLALAGVERLVVWLQRGRSVLTARLERLAAEQRCRPVLVADEGMALLWQGSVVSARPAVGVEAVTVTTAEVRPEPAVVCHALVGQGIAAAVLAGIEAGQSVGQALDAAYAAEWVVLAEYRAERAAMGTAEQDVAATAALAEDDEPATWAAREAWPQVAPTVVPAAWQLDMEPAVEEPVLAKARAKRTAKPRAKRVAVALSPAQAEESRQVVAKVELGRQTVAQLRADCKAKGLKGYSRLAKAQLVALLAGQ